MECWVRFFGILITALLLIFGHPDVVASAVLSGNRNFEGRVHPLTRANYLASPPLVVAYALAGTVSTFFISLLRVDARKLQQIAMISYRTC